MRYIWNEESKEFFKLKGFGLGIPTSSLHCPDAQQGLAGLSAINQQKRSFVFWHNAYSTFNRSILFLNRRAVYGRNVIHVPVTSVLKLLVLEVLNPFYIFQVFSIIVWILIFYYFYATAIAIMSTTGIVITIVQTRKVIFFIN